LFVSSVLFVFWYQSPNFLDKPLKKNRKSSKFRTLQHLRLHF
jgi:hypothetical protein